MLQKLFLNPQNNFSTVKNLTRNKAYKKLSEQDISHFQKILGINHVKQQELQQYNNDWMNKYKGNSELVLFPTSNQELSQILKYCNQNKLAVVPQSGNTGLVGGSVPVFDEIIVNLQKMNKIINFDVNSTVLTVEGGVILEEMNNYLKDYQCEIPWDLGAKGSCLIGGNISTNAGGKYYVKYGPLRANILGLEVVLPNGEVMDLQSQIRKDNTGVDLKQLFIGSEGILGIITKANILCSKLDNSRNLLYVNCSSYNDIIEVYKKAKKTLNKNLAAIEWMDAWSFNAVMETMTHINNPFNKKAEIDKDYFVLIEINSNHAMQELEDLLFEELQTVSGFKDAIKAQNETQFTEIWEIRETVGLASSKKSKYQFKYDISLDIKLMEKLTQDIRQKLGNFDTEVVGYGHIGDSNLHINIILKDESQKEQVANIVEPYIFEYLQKVNGSISAEHGLGLMKAQYLHLQKPQIAIDQMKQLKNIFDPQHILNPYKCLP